MQIRESIDTDKEAIREVHQNAFAGPDGETVSRLAVDLLDDPTAHPILSLVAESESKIIGSVIFSTVRIDGAENISSYIMAPLAVVKENHRQGVGTNLIKEGLKKLKERQAEIVLVLGDPGYYMRTGFQADHRIQAPYELEYPEAWMAQELISGVLVKVEGLAHCAATLNSPEHW